MTPAPTGTRSAAICRATSGSPSTCTRHEPETIYVVPIKSDSEHFPPEGKLRVYRSRTGGHEWEALSNGLPQKNCYVNVLRDAMAVDSLDPCGIYFGTTGGQVYVSPDGGDHWDAIVQDLPQRIVGGGAEPAMIRVELPFHLRTLAGIDGQVTLTVNGEVTRASILDALEACYPMLRGTIRDQATRAATSAGSVLRLQGRCHPRSPDGASARCRGLRSGAPS